MLDALLKRLLLRLGAFLVILAPLVLTLFVMTRHHGHESSRAPLPHPKTERKAEPKSSERYYTSQLRKDNEAPYFGKMVLNAFPQISFFIPRQLPSMEGTGVGKGTFTRFYFGKPVAQIAYGIDDIPYFVNAFLTDFAPAEIRDIWQAHRLLYNRLRYQPDSRHFPGRTEVWQSSAQTYRSMRGDCEDFAILLADWLRTAGGYDARVVLGTYGKEGHAWVVVFKEEAVYLVEATGRFSSRIYPLAKFLPKYHPESMFTRDTFWVNTGSKFTTSYRGEAWKKVSRFVRFK
jgi:hypothetical protein